jgi:hypothetical protein
VLGFTPTLGQSGVATSMMYVDALKNSFNVILNVLLTFLITLSIVPPCSINGFQKFTNIL